MTFITKLTRCLLEEIAKNIKGLPNYGTVSKGLSRSGQPNEVGLNHLNQMGVDIVIKLNDDLLTKEKTILKDKLISKPINAMTVNQSSANSIAKLINTELSNGKRVHVHCKYGKDRTGFIIGTWRLRYNNNSLFDVKRDWKKYGTPISHIKICC